MSLFSLLDSLTLPLASMFAIPMLSGWSTSLNLVFISLTWTTLALTYSPLQLEFFGPLLLRFTLYLLPSFLFLAFDLGVPSLAVELKAQRENGLPGRRRGGGKRIAKVAFWSVFNSILAAGLLAGIEFVVTDVLKMKSLLVIKGSRWSLNHLPNPWKMAKHLAIGLVARNVLQYAIHRFLLHSRNNNILTRLHISWHHSHSTSYSLLAAYDHPLPYLLHHVAPLYLPAIALRFHLTTYLLLTALTSLENLFIYSGYNILPSTILLRGMARRVDAHMATRGKGNFGVVGVLDWACGTGVKGSRGIKDDVGEEMQKHRVRDRASNAWDDVGSRTSGLNEGLKTKSRKGKSRA